MKRDVLRCVAISTSKKDHVLEVFLDCGHTVRCFDPGPNWPQLRPTTEMDCYKCRRGSPTDHPERAKP